MTHAQFHCIARLNSSQETPLLNGIKMNLSLSSLDCAINQFLITYVTYLNYYMLILINRLKFPLSLFQNVFFYHVHFNSIAKLSYTDWCEKTIIIMKGKLESHNSESVIITR